MGQGHADRFRSRPTPSPEEVQDLIRRASKHELGVEFLVKGPQDAVAATFRVHAFAVDAARRSLAERTSQLAAAPRGR
jgi:hypothetical protein